MTRVCMAADLHGHLFEVPPCDLLLLAGDVAIEGNVNTQVRWLETMLKPWLRETLAKGLVTTGIVATWGNHDRCGLPDVAYRIDELSLPWHLLVDQRITLKGIKIFGSPWMPRTAGGFTLLEPDLERKWAKIPVDTNILLLHGAPYRVGDRTADGRSTGSRSLIRRIRNIRPQLAVFGHIHEARGIWYEDGFADEGRIVLVNASLQDETCRPVHPPFVEDIDFTRPREPWVQAMR